MEQTQYDVFISYSRKDYVDDNKNVIPDNEVSKIKKALTEAGITFWMDETGIVPGEDYADKIVKHMRICKIFLYISSEAANRSDWTRREIACALMYKKYVIPLLLDDSPFHDAVMLRIVDLDRIDYYINPQLGITKLIHSIKTYLENEKICETKRIVAEKHRQEELERQRKRQEEEIKRQNLIESIEAEIAALESQKTERKKIVLQKEQELKFAQLDLDECEAKILKKEKKLQELRKPQVSGQNSEQERREPDATHPQEQRIGPKEITFNVGRVMFKMIRVEGGSFQTGSPDKDTKAYRVEESQHPVTLNDYYIGETVVTQALWKAVMGNNPSWFNREEHKNPVEQVSWEDCEEFILRLNSHDDIKAALNGYEFRLPTEAEWEYAARGGKKSKGYRYAGSNTIDDVAWYDGNSNSETHPVKSKKANELGLYDMSGNVWEWCQDWFDSGNNSLFGTGNPKSYSSRRVLRGGSWYSSAESCRLANRIDANPDDRYNNDGLRLALTFL